MEFIEVFCVDGNMKQKYTFYLNCKNIQKGEKFENQGVSYIVVNRTDAGNLVVKEMDKISSL